MHKELNRGQMGQPTGIINLDSKQPILEQAETWAKHNILIEDSEIHDIFSGQTYTQNECSKCKHITYRFDKFLDISVKVP